MSNNSKSKYLKFVVWNLVDAWISISVLVGIATSILLSQSNNSTCFVFKQPARSMKTTSTLKRLQCYKFMENNTDDENRFLPSTSPPRTQRDSTYFNTPVYLSRQHWLNLFMYSKSSF
ncbi:predicted protein [Sclerotinia sclerotiorum 1980 UF-70]|uniref:Uncharacterized protein n=1 Tax=Sclerotinia sclerotiorum (strain ATCC 18683 / 1980 / Ss-1) TaxID=665079 RepID=A7EW89_SCLS1|nr:predicted protein [Sclerotinia sclerotiorum 1980 UF-70]EDN93731.1 predicted protein [Sclerotinia sclerotiorum 1980 UF-70]